MRIWGKVRRVRGTGVRTAHLSTSRPVVGLIREWTRCRDLQRITDHVIPRARQIKNQADDRLGC